MTKNQTKVLSYIIYNFKVQRLPIREIMLTGIFMLYKTIFIKTISVKCSQMFAENDLFKKKLNIQSQLFYVKLSVQIDIESFTNYS